MAANLDLSARIATLPKNVALLLQSRNRCAEARRIKEFFFESCISNTVTVCKTLQPYAIKLCQAWAVEASPLTTSWGDGIWRYMFRSGQDLTVHQSLLVEALFPFIRRFYDSSLTGHCKMEAAVELERALTRLLVHRRVCVVLLLARQFDPGSILYAIPKEVFVEILLYTLVSPIHASLATK